MLVVTIETKAYNEGMNVLLLIQGYHSGLNLLHDQSDQVVLVTRETLENHRVQHIPSSLWALANPPAPEKHTHTHTEPHVYHYVPMC